MLGAALCFSTGGLLCKLIPWSALAINGARNLISSMLIGCYLLAIRHRLRFNRYVLFGAVCMFSVTTLFTMANKMTTAANAIVLQYTTPIWIILMMAVFFRTRPTRMEVVTIGVVLLGILCFFFDSLSAGDVAGDLVAVLSGLFYGGLFIMNSFEDGDTLSALFLGQLFSGVVLSPMVRLESDFSRSVLIAVLVLGLVQVGFAYILFNEGTKYTNPVTASLIAAVEPILNPILVAVFWGERVQPLSLVGAFIVVAAVLAYNIQKVRQPEKA